MRREIGIVRESRSKLAQEHTFIDNVLDVTKIRSENESKLSQSTDKNKKKEDDIFKLRNTPKKDMNTICSLFG